MHINWKKELWFWFMLLLPLAYLAWVWNKLPQSVPIHFNMEGKANGWSNRTQLWLIITLIPSSLYLLMLLIPKIDPKNKISQMGERYNVLRLVLTLFITLVNLLIIFTASRGGFRQMGDFSFLLIGALFIFLGNYLPVTQPNYFIGLRTPWTLHSNDVWKQTHRLAGKTMFAAGLIIIITGLLVPNQKAWKGDSILWIVLTSVSIPAVYSYFLWKKEQNNHSTGENDKR